MSPLPQDLYRAEQVRALDRAALDAGSMQGIELMERAGEAAWHCLRRRWPDARRVAVFCGPGNNGGDGFVIARLALAAGIVVEVFCPVPVGELSGDARRAADALQQAGMKPRSLDHADPGAAHVLVDALLGTGLDRDVTGPIRGAIEAINNSGRQVLAVDVPSGLDADRGRVLGAAVKADVTVTFIGLKQGQFTGDGPDHCGDIEFAGLEVAARTYEKVGASARRVELSTLRGLLPPRRPRNAHKGMFGHVLVIGGDLGYAGAVRMAAESAARVGAGLVSVATRPEHAPVIAMARPELMARGVETPDELEPLLARASTLAIGPGLGTSPWSVAVFGRILDVRRPLVVDADALNLLARDPLRREDWILTPHPGEAARLLGCTGDEVQADRFESARRIQDQYGGVCILKGCGTVIADAGSLPAVCTEGNPGMASGGMGDVLTGVVAGLLAQGLAAGDAARLGVCLHAAAGDRAAGDGERGLLAGDLLACLRQLVN